LSDFLTIWKPLEKLLGTPVNHSCLETESEIKKELPADGAAEEFVKYRNLE
jgi:hypothetical protein